MPRSQYIYLVQFKKIKARVGDVDCLPVIAAFTVKYEAQDWATKYYDLDDVELVRVKDTDTFEVIPWS